MARFYGYNVPKVDWPEFREILTSHQFGFEPSELRQDAIHVEVLCTRDEAAELDCIASKYWKVPGHERC